MQPTQRPFEMPVSHTTTNDYGLGDLSKNQQQAKRLLAGPHEVLHSDENVLLGISTHASLTRIFLYRRAEAVLTYYLSSVIAEVEKLGIAAIQVALWRRAAPGLIGGTSGIIHTLLDRYDAVVSDTCVTPAGQRFWIDRLAEAHLQGWTVGLTNGDILHRYNDERPLLDWLQAMNNRGENVEAGRTCFFIAKEPTRIGDRT